MIISNCEVIDRMKIQTKIKLASKFDKSYIARFPRKVWYMYAKAWRGGKASVSVNAVLSQ